MLFDANLETIVDDWPTSWREPVNIEEVLAGPLADASVDPIPEPDQQSNHDSYGASSRIPTDSEAERAFEESRMKKQKEKGATSSTTPMIVA